MKRSQAWIGVLVALSLVHLIAAGCAPSSAPISPEHSAGSEDANPESSPTPTPSPVAELQLERVPAAADPDTGGPSKRLLFDSAAEAAVHDLVMRLGVERRNVLVMRVEEITIPAADFGCPGAPEVQGLERTSDLVPGQEIVLGVGGREFIYRAHGLQVVPCVPPAPFSDLDFPQESGLPGAPLDNAKLDLSRRMGIAIASVKVESVQAVEWPDASLGCPQPGMMYAQVITPGYRILLKAGDEAYEYHSDAERVVLCQPE